MANKQLENKAKLIEKKRLKFTHEEVKTLTVDEACVQLGLLEDAFNKYNEAHDIQLESASNEEVERLLDDLETVSDSYMKVKCVFTSHIPNYSYKQNNTTYARDEHCQSIKLPPVNIPTFDGKLDDWYSFKDQYISIIHNHKDIDDSRKMHYLKSSLRGQAAQVIESLATIGDNYVEAWALLLNRYDNERLIVQSHIQQLLTQTSHQSESVQGLKTLLDCTNKHLRALSVLKQPVDQWDAIIVAVVATRLPMEVRKAWEYESAGFIGMPTWSSLKQFVENRIHALSMLQYKPGGMVNVEQKRVTRTAVHISTENRPDKQVQCSVCPLSHNIYKCNTFMSATPHERLTLAKRSKLCFNCLRSSHGANQCTMEKACKVCGLKHHTLLHLEVAVRQTNKLENVSSNKESEQSKETTSTSAHLGALHQTPRNILLSTALVKVYGVDGQIVLCRALLDSGSQSHFVTTSLVTRLGIKKVKTSVIVNGISTSNTNVNEQATLHISSRTNNKDYRVHALIAPRITVDLPTTTIDTSNWTHLQGINLADPSFDKPSKIDLLIGAEIFFDVIQDGKRYGPVGTPVLQNSIFGWIVAGRSDMQSSTSQTYTSTVTCCATYQSLGSVLEKFWKIEEVPRMTIMSKEDQLCENHFIQTHKRQSDGRYVVRLPFKESPPSENNTYDLAVRRMVQVEKSLAKNSTARQQYKDFMSEYLQQKHMELVKPGETHPIIFLPHHHILRPTSVTTKLRVVFDGSTVMNNGKSLNELLYRGHKLQRDMTQVITRFRLPRYVYTADIRQMFRQISIHTDDRQYQGIVWRDDPSGTMKVYRLNTVTYGLITSPFHALRTLQQLAVDEKLNYPVASQVLQNDFYVDEVMSGSDNLEDAKKQIAQLQALLHRGCFELRKWASNSTVLLNNIPREHQVLHMSLSDPSDDSVSILGIMWSTERDTFYFKVEPVSTLEHLTKRELLSEIARTYDPCGWLAPVVIVAKIMMQHLWKEGTGWDEPVNDTLLAKWLAHRHSYNHIKKLEIPRHICCQSDVSPIHSLHGFCDSSERAYAAAVYLVSDNRTAHLLVAKTRVAPLKKVTIPRLELCGAVLLAQLMHALINSIGVSFESVLMWTDSTVALQWISSDANKWTTFVSNRVTQIQELVPTAQWRHVRSTDNPADLASRGVSGDQLTDNSLWWHGPAWLIDPNSWPLNQFPSMTDIVPEERLSAQTMSYLASSDYLMGQDLFLRCSNYERITRIGSYIVRFCLNCRPLSNRSTGPLTVIERRRAKYFWIRCVQQMAFYDELSRLRNGKAIKPSSTLASLNPFIDQGGMLRVGGRLQHADITDSQKYPTILPKSHSYVHLLIKQIHTYNLHAGLEITLSILRREFWVIHSRSTVKRIIHNCTKCVRYRKIQGQQIMADLPSSRVTISHAFQRVGVDFAGPFDTKVMNKRSRIIMKSYLALFICLTTKAVHLEVVSNLTTDAFIATLRRFVSRRGYPSDLYSDNGTNFVGTNYKLQNLHKFVHCPLTQEAINNFCLPNEIKWHFSPPMSPHHGGLWEANIKSVKVTLHRVMGNTILNFEELTTIFCQIEALMNSRPLHPISTDPTDYAVLTPGHFLVGRPLLSLPEEDVLSLPTNRLSRWNLLQQLKQTFWKQWSTDYLNTLQQRSKWKTPQPNFEKNDLVLLKEDNSPPAHWPLARVMEVYPNATDGQVRVVKLRTQRSTFTRPITRLIKLPMDTHNTDVS